MAEIKLRIHLTQWLQKPNASNILFRKVQLSLSKSLERSNLISILGFLVVPREWMISWDKSIPSRICLPSTYPNYSGDIRDGSRGLSLLAMVLVIILKITLQREMGLNLLGDFDPFSLGIRERKVELKAFRTFPVLMEFSTISKTYSLMVSQQA